MSKPWTMTDWYLYFLACQLDPKRRFRDYTHFLDWLTESIFND